jgi:hypothetical protein
MLWRVSVRIRHACIEIFQGNDFLENFDVHVLGFHQRVHDCPFFFVLPDVRVKIHIYKEVYQFSIIEFPCQVDRSIIILVPHTKNLRIPPNQRHTDPGVALGQTRIDHTQNLLIVLLFPKLPLAKELIEVKKIDAIRICRPRPRFVQQRDQIWHIDQPAWLVCLPLTQ